MASKSDIVDHLANQLEGITKKQAAEAFDAVFDYVTKALAQGDKVQLPGFGTFTASKRAAREGRNPATGAKIKIKASTNVRFKAGKGLKDAVN